MMEVGTDDGTGRDLRIENEREIRINTGTLALFMMEPIMLSKLYSNK